MAATRTGRPAVAAAAAAARSGVPWGLTSLRPGLAPFGGTDDEEEEDEDEEDDGEGARGAGEAGRPLPAVGVAPPSSRSLPPLLLLRALLVPAAGGVCSASASCALRFVLVLLPLPLGGLRPTMGPRPLGRLGCCWSSISIRPKKEQQLFFSFSFPCASFLPNQLVKRQLFPFFFTVQEYTAVSGAAWRSRVEPARATQPPPAVPRW
jgi:hypothetical protein